MSVCSIGCAADDRTDPPGEDLRTYEGQTNGNNAFSNCLFHPHLSPLSTLSMSMLHHCALNDVAISNKISYIYICKCT